MSACMIYTTVSGPEEARNIGEVLVSERLVACVNIVNGAQSIYRWNGKITTDTETLMIGKTTKGKRDAAIARITELHSYDIPCVVAYDMTAGGPEYLEWLTSECT